MFFDKCIKIYGFVYVGDVWVSKAQWVVRISSYKMSWHGLEFCTRQLDLGICVRPMESQNELYMYWSSASSYKVKLIYVEFIINSHDDFQLILYSFFDSSCICNWNVVLSD